MSETGCVVLSVNLQLNDEQWLLIKQAVNVGQNIQLSIVFSPPVGVTKEGEVPQEMKITHQTEQGRTAVSYRLNARSCNDSL